MEERLSVKNTGLVENTAPANTTLRKIKKWMDF